MASLWDFFSNRVSLPRQIFVFAIANVIEVSGAGV
jgi:hypothetical protein